jgi:AraC-like DNA-binding protein
MLPWLRLAPGKFFGPTLFQRDCGGLTLTLTRYFPQPEQPWHVHAHPGFFLLLDGEHLDRTRHFTVTHPVLTPLFHPATEPHSGLVGKQGMLGLNIEYAAAWLSQHQVETAHMGGYCLLDSLPARLNVFRLLACAFTATAAEAELETAGLELLEPLVRTAPPPAQSPPWLERTVEFLRSAYRQPVSLRQAAVEAGVHPVYFARVFRKALGCSVSDYLRQLRVAEAGRLIVQEGQPLAQAALQAGFADQAHFTRCCRLTLGCTPRQLSAVRPWVQKRHLRPKEPAFAVKI